MAPITEYKVHVSQDRLRRLSSRARHVVERHADRPSVAAVSVRVVPATEAYEQAYDAHQLAMLRRMRSVAASHERAERLRTELRVWGPMFAAELGADASMYKPSSRVIDDAIATAKRFVHAVRSIGEANPLPFTAEALEAVEEATLVAESALQEGRAATAEAEATGQAVRDSAVECQAALVLLRRVLTAVLGRRHADYRALRVNSRPGESDLAIAVDETASSLDAAMPMPAEAPVNGHGGEPDRPSDEFDVEVAAE